MTRLASRFGAVNLVRRDRPLTREELAALRAKCLQRR
ncbi:hypothetical protein EPIR_1130 [Erwinia piriflorinigrans CFBP 5888]|uniref:Uncharacterized protein n=1 Tax=Erwinia piriflorinigrans CFBP 5888 TaxID=1161919 RepID=V5Z677_9GAMM|nr:hypothetical protein EPIR_1130 [Erwinia piriflorinigrans CFBP 5888]